MTKRINNWLYKNAINVVAKRLQTSDSYLTPKMLIDAGWITEVDKTKEKTYYVEPNIKQRDKISVEFEHNYYRVWHGPDRTFIVLETSAEWLQIYLLLHTKYELFKTPNDIINTKRR